MSTALDNGQRLLRNLLAGAFVLGLLVALASTISCGGEQGQDVRTPVEAAVMRDFLWGDDCSIGTCSEYYRASDVDCYPTGETLRATPVYWCSVRFDDNRSTGACVNLAGSDLAMSGPVVRERCNALAAQARRTDGFFRQAHDLLP